MPRAKRPKTVGALRKSNYQVIPVREEMRKNLIAKIRAEEIVFPGIIGFENTVIPQIENAILAGQDMILLGERGQAKSRIIRSLTTLLDETIPKIANCEINDNPYDPICRVCRDKVAEMGDKTPLEWIPREDRYSEKLATPISPSQTSSVKLTPSRSPRAATYPMNWSSITVWCPAPTAASFASMSCLIWLKGFRSGCST